MFDHSRAEKGEWPLFSLLPISQGCTSRTVHPFPQPGMPFRETPVPCRKLLMPILKSLQTSGQNTLQPCPQLGSLWALSAGTGTEALPSAHYSLLCIRVAALAALWGPAAAPAALGKQGPLRDNCAWRHLQLGLLPDSSGIVYGLKWPQAALMYSAGIR